MNRITGYGYDSLDRLTTATEPNAVITSFSHDSRDNLTSVTDPENHATTYRFDDFGGRFQQIPEQPNIPMTLQVTRQA